jgi:4-methyl-5(b-hydroxyethyl)-thiazole monophosphate biosynthesis
MDAVRFAYENDKYTAAICAGPTVLADLGIPNGKKATCYPGCEDKMGSAVMVEAAAVTDGKVITGTSAGCAIPFGLKLIEALKGADIAARVREQIVIR